MMNPTIDAVIDEVEAYRGPDKAERVEALQDFIAGRETVSAILASYLEANPKRSPTTAANYRKAVDLWIEKHGDRPLRGVTRRKALEWLEEVGKGKARDTVQRYATVLSHLVDWDCRMDETPPLNPFKDIVKGLGKKHNGGRETYHPFTGDELKAVFKALDGRDDLKAAAMVSLFSGLRLSEVFKVVRMKVDGVDCYVLPDGQGKTDNAARVIPVHPRLADVVIPEGLKASAASVAFGRKLDSLKLGDGKVFHSLRKNFAGALEHMHCPELTAVRLLGHSPISISYRVYSKHRDAAALREWVEKVSFKLD
jgi:integrase